MAEKKSSVKKTTTTAKVDTKKPVAAKAEAKKCETKKTVKKAASKKPAVEKKSLQHYIDVINWKKGEAHGMDWLYIEVNAGDLLTEVEAGVNNLKTACEAIHECMLEGDTFIVEPKAKTSASLTVRYYCDNLSETRRKYGQAD